MAKKAAGKKRSSKATAKSTSKTAGATITAPTKAKTSKQSARKVAAPPPRRLRAKPFRSFKLRKRIRAAKKPLPSAFKLFKTSIMQLARNWRLFGGIVLVYLVLTVILVKGFGSNGNTEQLKAALEGAFQGSGAQIATGISLFGSLVSNVSTTTSSVASTYQTMLLLVISLVLIWALRHTVDKKAEKPKVKEAFYKGLTPLIPFVLVILVINLQLIPLLIANFLYSLVFGNGLAINALEKMLWLSLSFVLIIATFYMITSSIFALYIVTLPDLTPMAALRSARELVRYRRLLVLRKIIFLPIVLMIIAAVVTIPIIILSPAVAEWMFFALSMAGLAVFHSYIYNLYRALL